MNKKREPLAMHIGWEYHVVRGLLAATFGAFIGYEMAPEGDKFTLAGIGAAVMFVATAGYLNDKAHDANREYLNRNGNRPDLA